MENETKKLVISSEVLPAVFLKVLEAKKLLSKGVAKNSTDACKMVGVSRSAFYKYKDCVSPYDDKHQSKTITIYLRLSDEPGVLSSVLTTLYRYEANILTLNQNIPIERVADVTVTIRINPSKTNFNEIKSDVKQIDGVVECKKI